MHHELAQFSQQVCEKVDNRLSQLLPSDKERPQPIPEARLVDAMRYAVLGGGKRVRPLLCFASAQALCAGENILENSSVLAGACAIELIHAYSLVHDDLPAMDDDDLRRGQPTVHKQFDEATAILAGDALQTLAFSVLSDMASSDQTSLQTSLKGNLKAMSILANASGMSGMVGGQMVDITMVRHQPNLPELSQMHRMKTGALISASVLLGAVLAGCENPSSLKALSHFSEKIGLAFQIQDDILDCTASTEVLGKQQGADQERGKPTYVSLLGLDGARAKLLQTHSEALDSLSHFTEHRLLRQIADYIVARAH